MIVVVLQHRTPFPPQGPAFQARRWQVGVRVRCVDEWCALSEDIRLRLELSTFSIRCAVVIVEFVRKTFRSSSVVVLYSPLTRLVPVLCSDAVLVK